MDIRNVFQSLSKPAGARRFLLLGIPVAIVIAITFYQGIFRFPESFGHERFRHPPGPRPPPHSDPDVSRYLSRILSPVEPSFTDFDGNVYELKGDPVWREPLGRQICLLDMDDRPINATNQAFNPNPLIFEAGSDHELSHGLLSHYLYAQMHGYSYKFARPAKYEDRGVPWAKPSMIAQHLAECRFVIFLDSDTIFHYPQIPLEWLFNRWGITEQTSISLPMDPVAPWNNDLVQNQTAHNTGFVIAQANPRTLEILRAWDNCVDDTEHAPRCNEWRHVWAYDQTGWSAYTRYQFTEPTDILPLPCAEANGFPESRTECPGVFLQHYWGSEGRKLMKQRMSYVWMNYLFQSIHLNFLDNQGEIVNVAKKNVVPAENEVFNQPQ